ncbi:MAG TPA: ABC transporter permease [Dehalococcoidia bacterium]|nr:ABC transporter permease [Dehalococcoidia bacterium]
MAISEIGRLEEIEGWAQPVEGSVASRAARAFWSFARRKPLGAVCGLVVIAFIVVGDLVPETLNKASSVAGFGTPVPYLADQLEKHTGIVYPYGKQNLRERLQAPSARHLLGTDPIGRDTFSRLLYGARVAVMVAFGAVFLSEMLSAVMGISAGYYGGIVDKLAYRVVDVFQALPGLVVLITVLGLFGSGGTSERLWQLILVIGIVGGPPASRTIRGQTLSVMSMPFLEAARVVGASNLRIMLRYVLPNVFALMILSATLRLGVVVLLEANLSFLGYGLPPPYPSWGQMLNTEGTDFMRVQPGLAIYPGLAIGLLVFSFNLFGDALRDVLDPRLRGSR